jgi:hypothetical protein
MRALAVIADYAGLVACLRARAEALAVSNVTLDEVAGLSAGYSGHLLSPNPSRRFGAATLGPALAALGLRLVVVEDPEGLARIRGRLVKRARKGRHRTSQQMLRSR